MVNAAWKFLKPLYTNPPKDRLHVTLTYAQSLDGLIAGPGGQQITLSSNESMTMTHSMRLHMDGIIIGINTLINDSPRLTAREEFVGKKEMEKYSQPTPIVLDSKLRCPIDASLITNAARKAGKTPIILTTVDRYDEKYKVHWRELEDAGAHIYSVDADAEGHVDLRSVFRKLKSKGMQFVMIEGGATIIKHCLKNNILLDALVVTIAPTYIGKGVSICSQTQHSLLFPYIHLTETRYGQFGRDVVMASTVGFKFGDRKSSEGSVSFNYASPNGSESPKSFNSSSPMSDGNPKSGNNAESDGSPTSDGSPKTSRTTRSFRRADSSIKTKSSEVLENAKSAETSPRVADLKLSEDVSSEKGTKSTLPSSSIMSMATMITPVASGDRDLNCTSVAASSPSVGSKSNRSTSAIPTATVTTPTTSAGPKDTGISVAASVNPSTIVAPTATSATPTVTGTSLAASANPNTTVASSTTSAEPKTTTSAPAGPVIPKVKESSKSTYEKPIGTQNPPSAHRKTAECTVLAAPAFDQKLTHAVTKGEQPPAVRDVSPFGFGNTDGANTTNFTFGNSSGAVSTSPFNNTQSYNAPKPSAAGNTKSYDAQTPSASVKTPAFAFGTSGSGKTSPFGTTTKYHAQKPIAARKTSTNAFGTSGAGYTSPSANTSSSFSLPKLSAAGNTSPFSFGTSGAGNTAPTANNRSGTFTFPDT